jgi:hypothetical protein
MKESDIKHENGGYWVGKNKVGKLATYSVFRNMGTHSVSDSHYVCDTDGLSIAIARCNYLASMAAAREFAAMTEDEREDRFGAAE